MGVLLQSTYDEVYKHFEDLKLVTEEFLFGNCVCYIHVKKKPGLDVLFEALCKIQKHENIQLKNIKIIITKKNKNQKKGIYVIIKTEKKEEIEKCISTFNIYSDLNGKCKTTT